jgi:hypothetical protein
MFYKSRKHLQEMQWHRTSFFEVVADSNFAKTKLPNKGKTDGK